LSIVDCKKNETISDLKLLCRKVQNLSPLRGLKKKESPSFQRLTPPAMKLTTPSGSEKYRFSTEQFEISK
jgi:hypothetical protein